MRSLSYVPAVALLASAVALAGCSTSFAPADTPAQSSLGEINGTSFGGRQPISGGHIYAYAAGTTGYGSASVSLLTATSAPGYTNQMDANGNYYVPTTANGNFSIAASTPCTAGTQVYLYSIGGNPGNGGNDFAGLIAALGQCPSNGLLSDTVGTKVTINEAFTVSAAYALAGFATDATDIGSSGTPLRRPVLQTHLPTPTISTVFRMAAACARRPRTAMVSSRSSS